MQVSVSSAPSIAGAGAVYLSRASMEKNSGMNSFSSIWLFKTNGPTRVSLLARNSNRVQSQPSDDRSARVCDVICGNDVAVLRMRVPCSYY